MRWLVRVTAVFLLLAAIVLAALPWVGPWAITRALNGYAHRAQLPLAIRTDLSYCWTDVGPGMRVTADLVLPGTDWRVAVRTQAAFARYEASVRMPSITFNEKDPLVKEMLRRYPVPGVTNLALSGTIALDASVRRSWSFPVPVWKVELPLSGFQASGFVGGTPVSIAGLSLTPTAEGVRERVSMSPLLIRAQNVRFGEHVLTNFFASAWTARKTILVSEAGAGYCDGNVRLHSLYLDLDDLDAGCTLYFENLDARQLMASCAGFRGRATGRLNGRMPISLRKGSRIRLRDAYLYSPPGETGKFELEDPERFTEYLAYSGVDAATRANTARVLENVDYDVLRLNLVRDGEGLALRFTLRGSATRGATTVPVSVALTLRGDLEQLANAGLMLSGRKESLR